MNRIEFPAKVRVAAFQRADGKCESCGAPLRPGKFRYDHRLPCELGGEATLENCQCLCDACDAPKTAADQGRIAKAKRQQARHIGAKVTKRIVPGSRASKFKKHLDGRVTLR